MFDCAEVVRTDEVDLSRPSLEGLAWLLRHRSHWPEGFEWQFFSDKRCAIGLANRLWGRLFDGTPADAVDNVWELAREMFPSLTDDDLFLVFMLPSPFIYVSPERVAKRIDRLVAEKLRVSKRLAEWELMKSGR